MRSGKLSEEIATLERELVEESMRKHAGDKMKVCAELEISLQRLARIIKESRRLSSGA